MSIISALRKNIGTIVAVLGFILLCIVTFGNLGELSTDAYWQNVKDNFTAISFVSIGLTLIQIAIKQGLAEQALQRGLNTENTRLKYEEHKKYIKDNADKTIYLPYFLQIYNKRHTALRKREFLVNNNYTSEESLFATGNKKLIGRYNKTMVKITAADIKWSTTEIVYNKEGRIITLNEHRIRRTASSVIMSFAAMIGVTFLTGGLFFTVSTEPLWQKFVKLFTYIVTIAITSVFSVVKEYEKGAFGVPNELDEINQIWHEFATWEVPDWVKNEVVEHNKMEVDNEDERKQAIYSRTAIQSEPAENESVQSIDSNSVVDVSGFDGIISLSSVQE
jgi:hypothetical protein